MAGLRRLEWDHGMDLKRQFRMGNRGRLVRETAEKEAEDK
jgi:hypothetical protein